nr:carboxymuconolactone decarboxylase family protein [Streptomyces sp. yr375]
MGILMAKGYPAELRNHVLAGLGNGLTAEELLEATVHAVPYLGFPAAGQALEVVAATLNER